MGKQSTAHLFRCYIWLVDTIYTAGHITREGINRKWCHNISLNDDRETTIPERTFHNWRHAIEDLFQICIECDRSNDGAYYIEHVEGMERGGIRQWLINTFAVNNLINESHHLKHQILFEKIPSGQRFLTPIIEAMRDHLSMRMTYHSFHKAEPATFLVNPYCVKVFKQRWYMVGKSEGKKELRVYALDRIVELQPTEKKYNIPANFDGETFFSACYGVSGVEQRPVQIEIKVEAYQANYLRALPLHDSQQEIERTEQYSIFRYYVVPTYEFKQELLSHGANVEVLAPASLREEIKKEIEKTHVQYITH